MTPPRMESPVNGSYSRLGKTFLHPTVSRLRSYTPQGSPLNASTSSAGTSRSHMFAGPSPSPSHFSAMSRMSSVSNLQALSSSDKDHVNGQYHAEREVFRWTALRNVGQQIFSPALNDKASALLGSSSLGSPTVLAANGLICVGTDEGRIYVYDFKQNLKCICGSETTGVSLSLIEGVPLSL